MATVSAPHSPYIDAGSTDPLIRKLESICDLTAEEREALAGLATTTKLIPRDHEIVHEGDRPSDCSLLVNGFACRYKMLHDGRRQIMAFHVAGDFVDLHSFLLSEMDHSVGTLTPATVALVPHAAIREITETNPGIARAFWLDTLIDAAIFRQWLIRVGRRTAYERIAHLFCEMLVRMKAVGLSEGNLCLLPITQSELGDALGLTPVHVNRTLQQMRNEGLISFRSKMLEINNWERLAMIAEFDPKYLYIVN